ncbi:hypothetical protein Tco_0830500 [Tanacetum coccineum]
MPQRMARLEEDVYEIRGALTEQREGRSYLYTIFSDPYVLLEARRTETWRCQHLRSSTGPTTARPMILTTFIFCLYIIKPGSKFSTIVHEYGTKQDIHTKRKNGNER